MALASAASSAGADSVGHARVAIDSGATMSSPSETASRFGVVILQSWQTDRLHALKAASPGVRVLMYQNLSAATSSVNSDGSSSAGVSYATAKANGWLLTDTTTGKPFTFDGYPWLYAANIGLKGYQDAWATNVVAKLKSDEWDGVFMDDTNPTIKYHHTVSTVQEYPSDATYGAATGAMLANVGPRIQAAGKLAIGNMGGWVEYPSVVKSWLPYVSGGMDEKFLKWGYSTGVGYRGESQWDTQIQEIKDCESAGKFFIGVMASDNTDRAAARFGYASALLAGGGHTEFTLAGDYTNETWFPEYDEDLGAPAGAETVSGGLHRRAFAHGLVVVNPTASSISAQLGGTYSGSGLTSVTSATLPPNSALVLTKDATPDPTPTPIPVPVPTPRPAPAPTKPTGPTTPRVTTPTEPTATAPAAASAPAATSAPKAAAPQAGSVEPAARKAVKRKAEAHKAKASSSRTLVVQAEKVGRPAGSRVVADRSAHGARGLLLSRTGAVTLHVTTRGLGILRVRARGARCRAGTIVVRVDGRTVYTGKAGAAWRSIAVRIRPAGAHTLSIGYRAGAGRCGALELDDLTVSPV